MSRFAWRRVAGLALATLVASGSLASAETFTLELKRLEPGDQQWIYRSGSSQSFFMQFGLGVARPRDGEAEFRKIVKKEPEKYVSKEPLRGVAKLGSGRFAFVLDAADEKSKGYDRLYFDRNGNGDLTDDTPIDSITKDSPRASGSASYVNREFPRVDLSIPVEGKPLEYSFLFRVYSHVSQGFSYASASLSAAAYRVGEITLDGKKLTVALVDHNANGRFDDQTKILTGAFYAGGGLVAEMGDLLLIEPGKAARSSVGGYGYGYGDDSRQHLSKLAKIGDRFYDITVSPAGDRLTLTPSKLKTGHLTNPNGPYTGMIYGDRGFLPIGGEAGKPLSVPEGEWKLLAYGIEITGWKPPPEKKDAGEKKNESKGLLAALAKALTGTESRRQEPRYGPEGVCSVQAQGTAKGKPVTVRAGQTVTLPFGPPYQPVVEARTTSWAGGGQVELSMSLVGSGGESVSSLVVDGYRPPKPEFTITDPKGEVVQKGSFEYG